MMRGREGGDTIMKIKLNVRAGAPANGGGKLRGPVATA
jgi:hypothetical protein